VERGSGQRNRGQPMGPGLKTGKKRRVKGGEKKSCDQWDKEGRCGNNPNCIQGALGPREEWMPERMRPGKRKRKGLFQGLQGEGCEKKKIDSPQKPLRRTSRGLFWGGGFFPTSPKGRPRKTLITCPQSATGQENAMEKKFFWTQPTALRQMPGCWGNLAKAEQGKVKTKKEGLTGRIVCRVELSKSSGRRVRAGTKKESLLKQQKRWRDVVRTHPLLLYPKPSWRQKQPPTAETGPWRKCPSQGYHTQL